jgi:hypothetical protein
MPRFIANLAPSPYMIHGWRHRSNLTLAKAEAEVVDNSLDAGAKVVKIIINKELGLLTVSDDGVGCVEMEALMKMGERAAFEDAIGRYGIGLKEAAIWLSSETTIISANGKERLVAEVNWGQLMRTGRWDNAWDCDPSTDPPGTSISFKLLENRIKGQAVRSAKTALAVLFSPGLRAGRQILFDGVALEPDPVTDPPLEDVIEHRGQFEGKPYRLRAGLLAEPTPDAGYWIVFRHRVIDDRVMAGCGGYNPSRFFGYLDLSEQAGGERWSLDLLKHGFDERDELLEQLFPVVEPLLKKSDEKSYEIHFDAMSRKLEAQLEASYAKDLVTDFAQQTA